MSIDPAILDEIDTALRDGEPGDRWRAWSFTPAEPDRVDIWRGGRIAHMSLKQNGSGYVLTDAEGREWWRGDDFTEMASVARKVLLETA